MSDDLSVSVLDSIHDVNANQWNNLIEQSDIGTVFHRHGWLAVVEEYQRDTTPMHAVVWKQSNPVAVLPNVAGPIHMGGLAELGERLPFKQVVSTQPGFGGPVIGGDEAECLPLLFDAVDDATGLRTLFHAVRTNDLGYVRYGKWLAKRGYEPTLVNCRFKLDLREGWDSIHSGMQRGRRKALRDADELDVVVEERPANEATAEATYESYASNVERAGGIPFCEAFYEGLMRDFGERVRVFTARYEGEPIGTYVYVLDDEQSTMHFYFSAIADESCFDYHPSEVLHRRGIQWAIDNGYREYDFGATGAHFDENVFRYKARYGAEAVPTLQWRRGHSRFGWPAFKLGRKVYRKRAY